MAKLYLKLDQSVVSEYELKDGTPVITIGRLPENTVRIENLAVSGHHARIVWEDDHFAIEDSNSLNGTFVNNLRIHRCALKHGDTILIGKHTLTYWDESRQSEGFQGGSALNVAAPVVESTVMLDSRKAKKMMAAAAIAKERVGQLQVVEGKTAQRHYLLEGKVTVIGKSDMASVKLKGWFAPNVAAVVTEHEGKYRIAASDKGVKVKINNSVISGQKELQEGDLIEVAKVKMTFTYAE
jgi:hypothetical protein